MKTVIVGGVAGGMSAATRLRRLDEKAEIVVLERSGHVSFANCGLPYYVGGVISQRTALLLQTPQSLKARFGIDVRVESEVTSIDRTAKTVSVRNLSTGVEYTESYDSLVLAPGAAPFVPPIPGVERALVLRNIADTDKMADAVDELLSRAERERIRAAVDEDVADTTPTAVIMGGGFIGVELAENLTDRGLKTTI
ncbi:MAG: CoA-disulfide reductase, partial [Phenylobacterium zucineum]